jgi:transcriptional regulator with XRE-family HTH domain
MDGKELKEWMKRHRWTVAALSRELDVHASTVQRWRNGANIPEVVALALKTIEREQ